MRRATLVLMLLCLLPALAGRALAQSEPKGGTRPESPPGTPPSAVSPVPGQPNIGSLVYIGATAPDFELDGSQGRPVRLSRLRGYWVLLLFSDRRTDLLTLRTIEPELRSLGVKSLAICADNPRALVSTAMRDTLDYLMLSDARGEISQMYGLYDRLATLIRPGFVLVDRQGVVRMALAGQALPMPEVLDIVRSAVGGS